MSCGQDNRGALHTFSIYFAFAYSQVRSNTMSKQSLEETVKLRNTSAYDSKVSVLSNEAFLRRLMVEPSTWVGVLICTDDGDPVGIEVALERILYCRQARLRAYYATVFTVSGRYRRRGIG